MDFLIANSLSPVSPDSLQRPPISPAPRGEAAAETFRASMLASNGAAEEDSGQRAGRAGQNREPEEEKKFAFPYAAPVQQHGFAGTRRPQAAETEPAHDSAKGADHEAEAQKTTEGGIGTLPTAGTGGRAEGTQPSPETIETANGGAKQAIPAHDPGARTDQTAQALTAKGETVEKSTPPPTSMAEAESLSETIKIEVGNALLAPPTAGGASPNTLANAFSATASILRLMKATAQAAEKDSAHDSERRLDQAVQVLDATGGIIGTLPPTTAGAGAQAGETVARPMPQAFSQMGFMDLFPTAEAELSSQTPRSVEANLAVLLRLTALKNGPPGEAVEAPPAISAQMSAESSEQAPERVGGWRLTAADDGSPGVSTAPGPNTPPKAPAAAAAIPPLIGSEAGEQGPEPSPGGRPQIDVQGEKALPEEQSRSERVEMTKTETVADKPWHLYAAEPIPGDPAPSARLSPPPDLKLSTAMPELPESLQRVQDLKSLQDTLTPIRQISWRADPGSDLDVQVRIMKSSGDMQVTIHTENQPVAKQLQEGVSELVTALRHTGFAAEAELPALSQASGGENQSQAQPDSRQFRSREENPRPAAPRSRRNASRWVELGVRGDATTDASEQGVDL